VWSVGVLGGVLVVSVVALGWERRGRQWDRCLCFEYARVSLELVESLADGRERVAAMLCSMVGALLVRPTGRSVAVGPPTPLSSDGMVCVVLAS